jgi:hypothetical protein
MSIEFIQQIAGFGGASVTAERKEELKKCVNLPFTLCNKY